MKVEPGRVVVLATEEGIHRSPVRSSQRWHPRRSPVLRAAASPGWRTSILVIVVFVALVASGCRGAMMEPMGPGMHGAGSGSGGAAPSPVAGAPPLRVVATEFDFEPSEIRLRAGETFSLTLDNRGALFHDLTISELDLKLTADAGARATGSLTIAEPGRYRFICTVSGHAQAGMAGSLVVE